MTLPIYQVDAFTAKLFGGNPAAVIPLKEWLSDEILQKIALENNLSETAFYVPNEQGYQLRWFTPTVEVDLCGHATLATAFVIFNIEKYTGSCIRFDSRSGLLEVSKDKNWLTLNFPKQSLNPAELTKELKQGLGKIPLETWRASDDYFLVFNSQKEIEELSPDFSKLKSIPARGIIVTARAASKKTDFVSRFFAPASGIDEDPVTGSAHTKLAPYWTEKLQKNSLIAEQISARKGLLHCQVQGERVLISGQAKLYMKGKIFV